MKIREDVLAVILLDVINCFILAAPLLFSPPYVIVTPARTVVIPLLQFGVIALSVVRFRKKYPKLTEAQKKNAGPLRAWPVCPHMGRLCSCNLALLTRPALFLDPSCKRC